MTNRAPVFASSHLNALADYLSSYLFLQQQQSSETTTNINGDRDVELSESIRIGMIAI